MAVEGWTKVKLGNACQKIGSGATPKGGSSVYLDSGNIALIRSQNVYNEGFKISGLVYISQEHADQLSNVELQQGDVLLNITGDSVARCCQVKLQVLPARVNQHVAIIRTDPTRLNAQYLRYYLVNPQMQGLMLSWAGSGGTRNALTKGMIEAFEIIAPEDIKEQQAIACILGALDDKIELNRRMNRTIEDMARAIFKSWFVDFDPVRAKANSGQPPDLAPHIAELFPDSFEDSDLGEIPKGWKAFNLPNLIEINPTRRLAKGTKAPYLDMASMPTEGHSPESWIERDFGSGMRFMNGDTLVARITPCLENGKTAYVDFLSDNEIGWGSTEYIVLRPYEPIPAVFAYLLARSSDFRSFAIQRMTGSSGRQRVPADSLTTYQLASPTLDSKIFEEFGKVMNPYFIRIHSAMGGTRILKGLRDALLPKLITGDLSVPDVERIVGRCV